jgi:exosortase
VEPGSPWASTDPDRVDAAKPASPTWLLGLTGLAFLFLYWEPLRTLVRDWWNDPESGHGLLLGPLAVYLAWKAGIRPGARPAKWLGLTLLAGAVLMRYGSGLAAELFTMRMSMLGAAAGLTVYAFGVRQIAHWWLPTALLVLSIPIPAVVLNTIAFPLQLKASQFGAALLEWRHVPVQLTGNVIHLPGHSLFVTEACSGLRSLTALIALGVMIGGLWLKSVPGRVLIVVVAIPVGMLLNGVRVFLTGFLVQFVDPALGDGFMHYTEGWVIFVVAFAMLGAVGYLVASIENRFGAFRDAAEA